MARVFGAKDLQNLAEALKSKRLGWYRDGFVTKLDQAFAVWSVFRIVRRTLAVRCLAWLLVWHRGFPMRHPGLIEDCNTARWEMQT